MSEPDFLALASKLENSLGYAAPETRTQTIAEALREVYTLGEASGEDNIKKPITALARVFNL
jgi:hypothetical protein